MDEWGNDIRHTCPYVVEGYKVCPNAFPKPIPDQGHWWYGRPYYVAVKTRWNTYHRAGFRWDEDGYYNLTIQPYKRYPIEKNSVL